MSHFTVAVITKKKEDLEKMLEPYNENIEVEPYIDETKEEIISKAKERKERILKRLEEKGLNDTDDTWEKKYIEAKDDEELYKCAIYDDEKYDKQRKPFNNI